MSARRLIGWVPIAALLAACTGHSPFATVAWQTACQTCGGGKSIAAQDMSAEEAEAARSPQPALHALQTSQFFDALAQKHPESAQQLREMEKRSLALSKLQLRAAHALAYEDMKSMTLTEFATLLQRWMDKPTELLAYMQCTLDRVEGLDRRQVIRIARKLPPVSVALEALGREVPTRPAQAAGIDLRHTVIQDLIALLKTRQPDRVAELDDLQQRLMALSPAEMQAIHAIAWEEDKDKTLAQVTERLTSLIRKPGAYATYLSGFLARLQGLTAQGRERLVSTYPAALARLEDILYGPQPGSGQDQAATP